jgi:acetyl-CoA carboxylase, biotin carboxylase subunit
MFEKVLVANRGEIAVRVLTTLREMGVASVAVYADVDEGAPHVCLADEAVRLGADDPAASYLNVDAILAAARATGAQAIHPGYGFLSENADFARRVAEAGLCFIGPPAEVIARLGDKTEARRLMSGAGVPLIPGMTRAEDDLDVLAAEAEAIGYPVLVKAAAGGGGKGMRVVRAPEALRDALALAVGEARAAFGDGRVYLERFLERPRHVEVQILADQQGATLHLLERECSIQRRHQKIIEETPSPALDDALRRRMGEAAVAAARAAGYVNAGTVEFLLDEGGDFHFLEVNTRLQVEHPVTEWVTGLDLVRLQLEIAAGSPLPFTQNDVHARGHAIECRVYAEDAAAGFLPSPGRVLALDLPTGPGLRVDSGVAAGSEVPVSYDPILMKLSTHAATRPEAIARMRRALADTIILGVVTPLTFLDHVLASPEFTRGETHTGLVEERLSDWTREADQDELAALGMALEARRPAAGAAATGDGPVPTATSPWARLGAFDSARGVSNGE